MNILVTGGAGYIGSFMTKRLLDDGHTVVVIDSLEKGHRDALPEQTILKEGNLLNQDFVRSAFEEYTFDAVFHFAAYISVPESVKDPGKYYRNNITATLNLLQTMVEKDVKKIIFSSTAAVYGTPQQVPIPEDHPKSPESPYGHSKLVVEEILKSFRTAYDISYAILRYFNASGAALDGTQGEGHVPETHMIPCAIQALLDEREFTLFGTDYDTPDGTCVRDYIHVLDLVEGHVLAHKKISDEPGGYYFNVGTGSGYSNKEIVEKIKEVTGRELAVHYADRRPGDPSTLIADPTKIKEQLGFEPRHSSLDTIIESAWKWHQRSYKEKSS